MIDSTNKKNFILSIAMIISLILIFIICTSYVSPHTVLAASNTMDLNGTDTTKAQGIIINYVEIFGAVILVFSLGLMAIRMILTKNNESKREEVMDSFSKIIVGVMIVGGCTLIAGFLIGLTNNLGSSLGKVDLSSIGITLQSPTEDDKGTFVVSSIAGLFSSIAKTVFGLFNKTLGFVPLDKLIFNSNSPEALFGVSGKITVPPFSDAEWNNLTHVYFLVCSLCAPFVIAMVLKTGFNLIISANKPFERSTLQEDMSRWLFSLALIAVGWILIKGLFLFCGYMTDGIANMFKVSLEAGNYITDINTIEDIKTGSVLTTAIVQCLYAWKYFQINMLFMIRKIVLTTFYAFTPLAAVFWGMNSRTQAIQIWFGEMITNATMQFFYAFTFSVMFITISTSTWKNWFYTLVWMFALVMIAEVLRNTLQGLFTRLSGIDESSVAGKTWRPLSSAAVGAASAMKRVFTGNGQSALGKSGIGNPMNLRTAFLGALNGSPVFGGDKKGTAGANPASAANNPNGLNNNKKNPINAESMNTASMNGSQAENMKGSANAENANGLKNTVDQTDLNNSVGQDAQAKFKGQHNDNGNEGIIYDSHGNPISSGISGASNPGENAESNNSSPEFKNGYGYDEAGNPVLNTDKFNGMDIAEDAPIEDGEGNINLNNLKGNANKNLLFNNMLNDNLKKRANNPSTKAKILSGVGRMANFSQTGPLASLSGAGIANKAAVGAAINDTVVQMQHMAGGSDKLTKNQALTKLFGGTVDGKNLSKETSSNMYRFKRAVIKGDVGRATQVLAQNSPINKLSAMQRDVLIARTNPYTNVDGYSWR